MNDQITVIGGCGRIGLPIGMAIAELGYFVTLLDTNRASVSAINDKVMPYVEEGATALLRSVVASKNLVASLSPDCIQDSDIIIFTIGTTVDDDLNESNSCIRVIKQYLKYFNDHHVVVFCSTLAPGTMEYINNFFQEHCLYPSLAYCPERVAQGKVLIELKKYPHIVSALNDKALGVVVDLFSKVSGRDVEILSPREAELAKLFCNAARYINFAIGNQFLQIADSIGADFNKIFNAIKNEYPRMQHLEPPGMTAGPCLVKDTSQLARFTGERHSLCAASLRINSDFPKYILEKIKSGLNCSSLQDITIGLLGIAFKANIDDIRDSLSLVLMELLIQEGANILLHDPYLKGKMDNLVEFDSLRSADVIVIGVPHNEYKNCTIPSEILVIDVWNII